MATNTGGSGGGVSNITTTPGYGAPFLQPLGQQIGNQLSGLLNQPTNLAGLMPQVAGQNILQQAGAQTVANQAGLGNLQFNAQGQLTGATCGSGVAGYQQYLCAAQQNVGPNAYQQYMSPYQQQVINPTLQQYDVQSQINKQALPAAAIQAGAYGGARCGVEQGVYQSQSDLNRSVLQAQLEQQGFNQAQQAANTAFGQYNTLGLQQQGYASSLANMLNTYGSTQQGYNQSILNAMTSGNAIASQYPLQQLNTASGIFGQLTRTPCTPGAPLLTNPSLVQAETIAALLAPAGTGGNNALSNLGNLAGNAIGGITGLFGNLFGCSAYSNYHSLNPASIGQLYSGAGAFNTAGLDSILANAAGAGSAGAGLGTLGTVGTVGSDLGAGSSLLDFASLFA